MALAVFSFKFWPIPYLDDVGWGIGGAPDNADLAAFYAMHGSSVVGRLLMAMSMLLRLNLWPKSIILMAFGSCMLAVAAWGLFRHGSWASCQMRVRTNNWDILGSEPGQVCKSFSSILVSVAVAALFSWAGLICMYVSETFKQHIWPMFQVACCTICRCLETVKPWASSIDFVNMYPWKLVAGLLRGGGHAQGTHVLRTSLQHFCWVALPLEALSTFKKAIKGQESWEGSKTVALWAPKHLSSAE